MRPGARAAVSLLALVWSGSALARGLLLRPDTPPPANLAALDIEGLRARSARGDARATVDLGTAYAHGWKVARDPREASRLLTLAVAQKNVVAHRELALLLLRGDGIPPDPGRAIDLLRTAAADGDTEAMAALGTALSETPDHWAEAVKWTHDAAEAGNLTASANFGIILERGVIGAPDPKQAAYWYKQAADRGYGPAEVRLGMLYQTGAGVERDTARALALFRDAAERGDPEGEHALGEAYRLGVGVAADPAAAENWLRRAGDDGDAEAEYRLALLYDGVPGYPRNRLNFWLYMARAGEHGHWPAAATVGLGFMTGDYGPGEDHAKAAFWFQKAIAWAGAAPPTGRGGEEARLFDLARLNLGLLMLDGDGVARDPAGGLALIQDAARHDLPEADWRLGLLYHGGLEVAHADAKATDLFRRAAEQGQAGAAAMLGHAYAEGWAGTHDAVEALRWFRVAAALGAPEAWYALGRTYELGLGVPTDGAEAAVWYALAANAGRADAQRRMGEAALLGQLGQRRDPAVESGEVRPTPRRR